HGDAGGGMNVDVNKRVLAARFLDALHDVVSGLRFEERGHVLDADGIAAEILESFGHLDKLLDRVQRRNGVTKGALRVLAGAPNSLQGAAQITDVVEGVEDPKDIHAVLGRLIDEAIDDSILVVAIAEQILAAEKHLEPSVRHEFAKGTQA